MANSKPLNLAHTCVICGKPIHDNNDCFSMGSEGYRHKKCGPKSEAWRKKYPITTESGKQIRAMLDKKPAPRTTPMSQDPLRQAIKEFCGRIKYMRYMDTINKSKIEWEVYSQTLGIKHTSAEPDPNPEALYAQLK